MQNLSCKISNERRPTLSDVRKAFPRQARTVGGVVVTARPVFDVVTRELRDWGLGLGLALCIERGFNEPGEVFDRAKRLLGA